jgi:hypothetical protein
MFVQPFYFISYYFSWIEYDDFYFYFQETYNSRLRERYGDDPSTHPDFNPELWMEVGSFGGSDKNQVYGSPTLRPRICGRPVVSQSSGAPNRYRTPNLRSSWPWSNNILNSQWIINTSTKWSWTLDQRWVMIHVRLLFCYFVPRTTSLHHLLLLHHCSSLIFFWKHIKFVINIWMNIII